LDFDSDSDSFTHDQSDDEDEISDNEETLKSLIKKKSQKTSKPTNFKLKELKDEISGKPTNDNDFDSFMKQFSEMKIMLAETVNKLDKWEQNNKASKSTQTCKNCQDTGHDARICSQPCKICKGSQGIHPFYRCPEYRPFKPQTTQLNQETSRPTEHVLFEDDTFEQDYRLEDLFAHEDPPGTHSKKRVRVEEIEDEDEVRFVPMPKESDKANEIPREKKKAKPRPRPKSNEVAPPHRAAKQLMDEAKISLTLQQICELAPGFRAELRRQLVKPRKPKTNANSVEVQTENLLSTPINDQNGCCPRTIVTLDNKFKVNALLDGGAVPNIISLELVKKLGIQDLLETNCKYITANGQKSKALGIAQDISLNIQGQQLKFAAIVYNHNAFPLLLGRRVLKRLKIFTDWETCTWSMKTPDGIKRLPINFDTNYAIQDYQMEEESNPETEEDSDTTESECDQSEEDLGGRI